jgi:PrtD family type I secretion system ABC transporter
VFVQNRRQMTDEGSVERKAPAVVDRAVDLRARVARMKASASAAPARAELRDPAEARLDATAGAATAVVTETVGEPGGPAVPPLEAAHTATAAASPRDDAAALRHLPADLVDRLNAFGDAASAGPPPARMAATTPEPAPRIDLGTVVPAAAPSLAPPPLEKIGRGSELMSAIEASRRALMEVGWQSCAINVLMLTGPIFMLQVYDRVMTSGSYHTLLVLSLLTFALYGVIGALELARSRLITRIGSDIDRRIGNRVFEASIRQSLGGGGIATTALRELDTLRNFVSGPAPMTAFDALWIPVYMLVIFLTHWTLGVAGTIGAGVLLFVAWFSEARGRAPMLEAGKSAARAIDLAESGQRNADSIAAMGMLGAFRARWQTVNQESLAWQMLAADRLGTMSAISKTLRLLLQSMMLAIGAALALRGDISAGAIIAGTIIYGRALAPVEQIVGHWRNSSKAYESYKKLDALLKAVPPQPQRTALPRPQGHLKVEGLRVAAPETKTLILSGIGFEVGPGKMLAVIGPSGSGKSTLARAIVGLWAPFSGSVKLDETRLEQWNGEDLGQHIGYLPQDVELFGGTVRENIARFRADATDADVVAAAKAAHAHELILGLAKGYDTELGAFGTYLSAGQRQRIGLARAFFGSPPLIVLDEPNANLDRAGDEALASAIDDARARGQVVVLISHRVQAIGKADLLLYIERGVQRAFGPRDEVLRMINGPGGPIPARRAGDVRPPPETRTRPSPSARAGGDAAAEANSSSHTAAPAGIAGEAS